MESVWENGFVIIGIAASLAVIVGGLWHILHRNKKDAGPSGGGDTPRPTKKR